ncbi:Hypothetical predicted protein [Paramuricea clavata]|uniref:Uncharacterized protein n=1 Tax=Paramuricea clavata TaxID=317549 RepID=A0A7D9HJY1_PARCT|nr:Hypothetical predicted protein [Paramuricea clavata]
MKIISVYVAVAESPVAFSNNTSVSAGKERKPDEVFQSRRFLNLQNTTNINNIANPQISIINTMPESSPTSKQESSCIVLPLERYAKKQAEVVQNNSVELTSNTKELRF